MRKFIISMFIVLSTLITPISAYEIDSIPDYDGAAYVEIHDNEPEFDAKDMNKKSFESYSNLDDLNRPGVAYANVSKDLMPTTKRGSIGMVKPVGWHTIRYKGIDGKDGVTSSDDTSQSSKSSQDSLNDALFEDDHFHPNNTGYQIMSDAILKRINQTKKEWSGE